MKIWLVKTKEKIRSGKTKEQIRLERLIRKNKRRKKTREKEDYRRRRLAMTRNKRVLTGIKKFNKFYASEIFVFLTDYNNLFIT